jgi:2,3-bisphosphoglycerate-dependent phosphoglycerate mutase
VTTVYFVRHAASDLRHAADETRPLSVKGLQDRELVAAYLAGKGLDAIYSSPYRRAIDTVRPLADALGLTIRPDDAFRERRVAAGRWIADFDGYARRQWADFDYALPGGESLRQVQARNVAALGRLLRDHAGQIVAVGSHGTALSTIIHHFDPTYGYADFRRIQGLMPWIVRFTFDEGRCSGIAAIDLLAGAQVTTLR